MLAVSYSSKFKRDVKRMRRQGMDLKRLDAVILSLRREEELPSNLRDHDLVGTYKGYRECHVAPDWLLIYRVDKSQLVLTAVRTGSHSDLFGL